MPLDWRSVKSFHPQELRNGKISFLLLFPSGDLLWPTPATCTQEAWDAIQKCRGRRRIKGGLERAQAPQHFSNDHHTIKYNGVLSCPWKNHKNWGIWKHFSCVCMCVWLFCLAQRGLKGPRECSLIRSNVAILQQSVTSNHCFSQPCTEHIIVVWLIGTTPPLSSGRRWITRTQHSWTISLDPKHAQCQKESRQWV